MSYWAEAIMRQNMSPEEFNRNVNGPPPAEEPAAAAVPEAPRLMEEAKPAPPPVQPLTAQAAANITAERERFARAGYSEEETSRLLGGPRQKLGA